MTRASERAGEQGAVSGVTFSDEELREIVREAANIYDCALPQYVELSKVSARVSDLVQDCAGSVESLHGIALGIVAERARWQARVSAASDGLHALLGEGRR